MQLVSAAEMGFCPERLAEISPRMQRFIDNKSVAGFITLIARHGKIVHFEAQGLMDKEKNIPWRKDTIYRIYSMTKPIIATAFMILFERGLFQLVEPVAKYLPAFAHTKVLVNDGNNHYLEKMQRPMRIAELLIHTSGLTYDFCEEPASALYREARLLNDITRSLSTFVDELARLPLAFQPGTRWHYSFGLDVAAHLIELLSNQPLEEFLHQELFEPLGMLDTGFSVKPANHHRVPQMYGRPDLCQTDITVSQLVDLWLQGHNELIDVSSTHPLVPGPHFKRGGLGLFSTAQDYWHFAQMLADGGVWQGRQIISRKTLALMHQDHTPAFMKPLMMGNFPLLGYGYGLGSRVLINPAEACSLSSIGEYGWSGAANTHYWIDPVENIVGLYLAQNMVEFGMPEKYFQNLTYQALR